MVECQNLITIWRFILLQVRYSNSGTKGLGAERNLYQIYDSHSEFHILRLLDRYIYIYIYGHRDPSR
jgi:hypothetical protein